MEKKKGPDARKSIVSWTTFTSEVCEIQWAGGYWW
jgi:hypothetical protein